MVFFNGLIDGDEIRNERVYKEWVGKVGDLENA
jgi:hypothetical protein